jgi:hypothetical protein
MVTFHHCPRKSNGAADELAGQADCSSSGHWLDDPPTFPLSRLVNEGYYYSKKKNSTPLSNSQRSIKNIPTSQITLAGQEYNS